jgi:hypothetical protein
MGTAHCSVNAVLAFRACFIPFLSLMGLALTFRVKAPTELVIGLAVGLVIGPFATDSRACGVTSPPRAVQSSRFN